MATCNKCFKDIVNYNALQFCNYCKCSYHNRCIYGNTNDDNWMCFECTGNLFPFNHFLDDNEFKFCLAYFDNSVEYNRLLSLKFNPFLFDDFVNNDLPKNMFISNHANSCNYYFDCSLDLNIQLNDNFSILHLNSRSFHKNRDNIDAFLACLKHTFSVIAVSETWFKEDLSNLIDITNYSLVSVPRKNRKSGGVALYIHKSLSFIVRNDLNLIQTNTIEIDHSESVFVEIINSNCKNIIIGNIYRAHRTDIDSFNSDLSRCLNIISSENKHCYVSGDFNLDILKYDTESKINNFLTNFYDHNMFPLIDRPTRISTHSATILDNIFTNVFDKKIKSGVCVSDITDHYPIFQITNSISVKYNFHKSVRSRSFSQSNIRSFVNQVQLTNWDSILSETSANVAYNVFLDKFTSLYNHCFPLKVRTVNVNSNRIPQKPWITNAILSSIRRKNILYRKYRSSPTDSNKRSLVNYRNTLTSVIRTAKKKYYCNLLDDQKHNLKQTWKILNDLLGRNRKQDLPDCFDIDGKSTSDYKTIADGFNNFFTNIGPNLADKIPTTDVPFDNFLDNIASPLHSFFLTPTDPDEVIKLCGTLRSGASPGDDDIRPDIVKVVKLEIAPVLVHIFNLSIITGIVPDKLKYAKVVPIFKSGDSTSCNNYRPISILPVFSKVFERIIHKRLYNFLSHHNLLHHSQFGFRTNYSSYMAVLEAYNSIVSRLDDGNHTLGIFLDLSKAFDTINHDILLSKLHHYGVRGSALEWFKSYLTNRKQYVLFNNSKSYVSTVQCGVPQGSVLGPLLFIIFLNDIAFSSNNLSFFIYADDTNAIISHNDFKELLRIVNDELKNISIWFKANKLSLNIKKTNYIIFKNRHSNRVYNDSHIYIDGIELAKVSHTKFLGVIIDECLTWNDHTSYVTNIVSKYSGILFRLKKLISCKTLFSLYKTLVLPHLNYCNIIWGDLNNCNLNSVLVKQKRIIRLCTNSTWLAHTSPLFSQLSTLNIFDIHKSSVALFMYNFSINNLPPNFSNYFVKNTAIHRYSTRSNNLYRPAIFNYDLARNTIRRQGPVLWNNIPDNIKMAASPKVFKRNYHNYLISLY